MMKAPHLQFPMKEGSLLVLLACCAFAPAAFAGVEQTVNDLIPKLAAQKVEDRYGPQMELQSLAAKAARPGAEVERAELAKILAARAVDTTVPQPARVWIVRQIEYIGAAESVAALAKLLDAQDAELRECARRALEKNPDPAAGEHLRAALKQGGETAWRIGLIQSLGERGDPRAVALISGQLSRKETALAAVSALGKIADPNAVTALWEAYDGRVAGAADGLIMAGNRLLSGGILKASAKDIFKRLYLAGATQWGATQPAAKEPLAPVQVRSAALIGWATADPDSARDFIEDALQQKQPELQFAAVTAATVALGKAKVSSALALLLPKLPPTAKTCVLPALDASAENDIIAAAGDSEKMVQLAALERLGQIGGALSVPVLVKIASENASGRQKVAAGALTKICGPGVNSAIAKQAGEGDAAARAAAIEALAGRNDKGCLPALVKYASEGDPVVSGAACAALGKLATDNELEGLARLRLSGKAPGVEAALRAVASRSKDKAAVARKLIALARTVEAQQQAVLFEALTILGGSEALATVSGATASPNDELRDAAIRALANWPDFPATQPLLAIAADPKAMRVHSVLAIQGVVRLVKSSDKEPAGARLEAAVAAMKAANRDEEKRLVLSAFASVPDAKAADAIKPFLRDSKLQAEAGLAGVTLAEALLKTDKPAARNLAQAIKEAGLSEDLARKADAILNK